MKSTTRSMMVFCMAVSLFACVGSGKKGAGEVTMTSAYKKANAYLSEKRSDNTIYWGEGMANIGEDLGKEKIEARKRAISALADQIKIQVTSDVEMTINKSSVVNGTTYSEEVKKSISSKLETYTNQVLTNLKESGLFIDYPKAGTGTYLVYVSRKDYDGKVKNDLRKKKQLISDTIRSGDREFVSGNQVNGIRQYLKAKEMLYSFFGNIPIYDDIDEDGKPENLAISISERIRGFFSNLELSLMNSGFQYDSEGIPESLPRIYAQYRDPAGQKKHVAGLPLSVVFVKGQGQVAPVVTGNYGEAEVSFIRLNSKFRSIYIKVDIDKGKIPGLSQFPHTDTAILKIKLNRKKAVALAIHFSNNKKSTPPRNLKENITTALLDKNYSVLNVPFKSEADVKKSTGVNADYIFLVKILSNGGGTVGQYSSMYTSYCGAALKLYKMPLKTLSFSDSVKQTQGFGVSLDSAGWDGFGKINSTILKKAEKMIGRIE